MQWILVEKRERGFFEFFNTMGSEQTYAGFSRASALSARCSHSPNFGECLLCRVEQPFEAVDSRRSCRIDWTSEHSRAVLTVQDFARDCRAPLSTGRGIGLCLQSGDHDDCIRSKNAQG